jgi:hypothetical protein
LCQSTKECLGKDADFEGMSNYLSEVRWLEMLTANFTPNSIWKASCYIVNEAIERFVPARRLQTARSLRRKGTIYPRKVRRAISRKSCLWRKFKANPENAKIEAAYRNAENRCRLLVRNFEFKLESEVIQNENVGSF